jgi:hypothetical protein
MKYLRQIVAVVALVAFAAFGGISVGQAATKTSPKTTTAGQSKVHKKVVKTSPHKVVKAKKPSIAGQPGRGPSHITKKPSSTMKSHVKTMPSKSIKSPKTSASGKSIHVKGYYNKKGTYVKPYTRKAPGAK